MPKWHRSGHIPSGCHGATDVMTEWQESVKNQMRLGGHDVAAPKLVSIDLQPYTTTQAPDRDDILNIGGFSDAVFSVVAALLGEFREKLRYEEGAIGAAVAIGDRVVACDLFDKPSTCRRVWDRLLTGFVLDALEGGEQEKQAEVADAEKLGGSGVRWYPDPALSGRLHQPLPLLPSRFPLRLSAPPNGTAYGGIAAGTRRSAAPC